MNEGRKCEYKPISFFFPYDMRAAGLRGGCMGERKGEGGGKGGA